jgi:sec-independent protein translocase protein TatB
MIPQIGFAEMMVLALLAIIVVGPKDLPVLMRKIGGMMAKIRGMGQEFKDAFADMEAETEMAELRKEIQALKDMGKLTDDDLSNEMREIEMEVRDAVDYASPKTDPAIKPEDAG